MAKTNDTAANLIRNLTRQLASHFYVDLVFYN